MHNAEPEDLPFTGERFTGDLAHAHSQIYYEHLHRYLFAAECVKGDVVLDIACGEGYGSNLLAQTAAQVVGIDLSAETIAHAAEKYRRDNLRFAAGDCRAIPLDAAAVNVVVSFETIEHLADHDDFLREVRRVLQPGGRLIISSPDREEYGSRGVAKNPFHKRELTLDEFGALLRRTFRNVLVLEQKLVAGSVLEPTREETAPAAIRGIFSGGLEGGGFTAGPPKGLYAVAVCSDEALPKLPVGLFENLEITAQIWNAYEILPGIRTRQAEALRKLGEVQASLREPRDGKEGITTQIGRQLAELKTEIEKRGRRGQSLEADLIKLRELLVIRDGELEAERRGFRERLAQMESELASVREELAESILLLRQKNEELAAARSTRRQAETALHAEKLAAETQLAGLLAAHDVERRELRSRLQQCELTLAKQRELAEANEIAATALRGEVERKHAAVLDLTRCLGAMELERDRLAEVNRGEKTRLEAQDRRGQQRLEDERGRYEEQMTVAQQQLAVALEDNQKLMVKLTAMEADLRWDRTQSAQWQQSAETLNQMKSSWSWRITAPLRRLHQAMGDPLYRRKH